VVFGKQRPAKDLAVLALLLAGFCGLAVAIFYLRETLIGALLPLTFIAGAFAGLRGEVREVELLEDKLIIRTIFRGYAIPRAHVRAIVTTDRGTAIDVLSGARYPITPPGVDALELERALREGL
jgi:hypothetical protein